VELVLLVCARRERPRDTDEPFDPAETERWSRRASVVAVLNASALSSGAGSSWSSVKGLILFFPLPSSFHFNSCWAPKCLVKPATFLKVSVHPATGQWTICSGVGLRRLWLLMLIFYNVRTEWLVQVMEGDDHRSNIDDAWIWYGKTTSSLTLDNWLFWLWQYWLYVSLYINIAPNGVGLDNWRRISALISESV